MAETREIHCCACDGSVHARLTDGREIYPHRKDLADLPFWRCDACRNFVGCHHKTEDRTRPLGVIPTPELKTARSEIHKVLDPLWRGKRPRFTRSAIYSLLAERIGVTEYHTAEIRTVEEARRVYREILKIKRTEGET